MRPRPIAALRPTNDRVESPSARALAIRVTPHADGATLHAHGHLDAAGGVVLREVAQTLAAARSRSVQLDLTGVTSADIAGVRSLEDFRDTLEHAGSVVLICNADVALYPLDWHHIIRTD
jgi:anti-anti-sigma regulatory factor